ncbi:MAG: hypothetical protein ACYSTR_03995, partial [Planctomycetota bacterium]
MDKTGTHAIDFLKSLGSVDTVLAEAGNASLPDSLTYNSHIHLPPNFSAEMGIVTPVLYKNYIFVSSFFDGSLLLKLKDQEMGV